MLKFKLEDLNKDDFKTIKTRDGKTNFIVYQCNEFGKETICMAVHMFLSEIYIDREKLAQCLNGEKVEIEANIESVKIDEEKFIKIKPVMSYVNGDICIEVEEER